MIKALQFEREGRREGIRPIPNLRLGQSKDFQQVKVWGQGDGCGWTVRVRVLMQVVLRQTRPGEPSNMPSLSAFEVNHSPQRVRAKAEDPSNILFMLVTLDTFHLEMSALNIVACANIAPMLVTLDTSHFETSALKDVAALNMKLVSVTLATSHLEISALNDAAY